jgi:hypothetical protein
MNTDEATAAKACETIVAHLTDTLSAWLREQGISEVNYRLGHDEDRQKSNYLLKTPSGHVVNKKSRIELA